MTAGTAAARRVLISLCAMTGLLLGTFAAQATPVTVNLGQSAEQFVEHGLGPDISTGRGTYAFDQGNCLFDGTNTTCTLSGTFTGTTSGFTAGTYTFVTQYSGTGLSPIRGILTAGNPNLFNYLFPLSSSTSMTLNLFTTGGHFVEPLVTGGVHTATALDLNFTYVTYACSGVAVATCTPGAVGLTNGAIGQGPTTAVVTFDYAAATTTTASSTSTTTTQACDPQTLARAQIDAQCNCGEAANHGAYVKCVAQHVKAAVKMSTLPKTFAHPITMCAARSTCGKPGFVTCCRTTAKGVTKCSIKHGGAKCKAPKHGGATVGTHASCCDACTATGCSLPLTTSGLQ